MIKSASTARTFSDYLKIAAISSLVLILVYGTLFAFGSLVLRVFDVACENEISDEMYSPDEQYKVVIFQSDCGATTRLRTNASVLKAEQNVSSLERGNIYSSAEVVDIQVIWQGNRSIEIQATTSEVLVEKMQFTYDNERFEVSYQGISQE